MDYAKKALKYGKAVSTAVNSAVTNPEQFLHGQQHHPPQQQHQQQYQPQQIPHQYNPQQPPPYPPRPDAHQNPPPNYGNGPNQHVQHQQQANGYTHGPPLPPRPEPTNPYPPSSQPLNQQSQPGYQQWTGHIPATATAPYIPHPTSPPPAWSPNHQPPQPVVSPLQSSQPYSPPPMSTFSPPATGTFSPPPPVSPLTTSSTPVSHPFSPPLPASTPANVSPPPAPNAYPYPSHSGQFQGHTTPSPVSHAQSFGSHAGSTPTPYSTIPPATSYNGHSAGPSAAPTGAVAQQSFVAELPADMPTGPVEMLAELPGDLLPSKPAGTSHHVGGLAHAALYQENDPKPHGSTLGGDQVVGVQASSHGVPANSPPHNSSSNGVYGSPVIPPSTVTPSAQIQEPTPVHPQGNALPSNPTPPPAQWQAPAAALPADYNPSTYPSMPKPGPNSAHQLTPYPQPDHPVPYSSYTEHRHQQQSASPVLMDLSNQSPYGQPATLERMSSLAQKAQQLSLSGQSDAPAHHQYQAYHPPESGDQKLPQGPAQQQSFGLPPGYPQQQQQDQYATANASASPLGYHPYRPPPM